MVNLSPEELLGRLEMLRQAEKLKSTLRSGFTSDGQRESVAAHSWRLCLMVMLFADQFPDIDQLKLLKMCVIHDLGEAINGDIPAPLQSLQSKSVREREDFQQLLKTLTPAVRDQWVELWDDYEHSKSPEAVLAKAFDKLETILQHTQGKNPDNFDYRFNLDYGKHYTQAVPIVARIRKIIDAETEALARKFQEHQPVFAAASQESCDAASKTIRFYSVNKDFGEFSNFALFPIALNGETWPTSEHFFQAQKFEDSEYRQKIRKTESPMNAAKLGRDRKRKLRNDWETVKVGIMRHAVLAKFSQYEELRSLLLSTGTATLVEHTENDSFWGDGGDGSGQNMLGKILMEVRELLQEIQDLKQS